MAIVRVECYSCHATGLYVGFAEPPGVAVICLTCGGLGCVDYDDSRPAWFRVVPFSGRKRRDGIGMVQWSRGSLLFQGFGPTGQGIPYEEFLAGRPPPK